MKLYLIGSLRNPRIPHIANEIRKLGYDVVDDWWSPGPEADEFWQKHEKARGRSYKEALAGLHAGHVYDFDRHHLHTSDLVVLAMPCGRSGHIEFGIALGWGKPGYVLFEQEPERFDIMYRFATDVFMSLEELLERFRVERNT